MNQVIMSGRATGDPHIRWTAGNNSTCVADFSIAVSRRFKKEGAPDSDFFNCTAFGKTAESIEKHVKKGTKILITGNIQNDNYEKDHVKHFTVKIIIDSWEFAESKKAAGEDSQEAEGGYMPAASSDDENPFL